MQLQFAIMGTGKIAGKVTPYIQRAGGCTVIAAASRDVSRARTFAADLGLGGSDRSACTYDELLTRDDIDAVYITLPSSDHPAWSERLLEAGKHVLCEKPLCWSRSQAERLFDAACANGRVLAEAFMYLHSPLTARAIEIAQSALRDHPGNDDDSPIGKLQRIEAAFDISIEDGHTDEPKHNIRFSRALAGGSLMDLGCYPISFVRTVTGESPEALTGSAAMVDKFAGSARDGSDAVDGSAELSGVFPSGIAFRLSCSMIERPEGKHGAGPEVVARLIGDRGEALIRDFPRPDRIVITNEGGEETVVDSSLEDPMTVYTLQAESFARAARGECEACPSPAWSIEQASVIERALGEIGLRFDEPGW